MKKKIYLFAAAALALASCSEEEMVQQNGTNQLRKIEITAGMPDGESRTSFTNGGVLWQENDALNVFVGGNAGSKFTINDADAENEIGPGYNMAKFSGSSTIGTDYQNNVAYYPYTEGVTLAYADDAYTLKATFPAEQQFAEAGSFGQNSLPMIAVTETTAIQESFQFKTLGGWLQLYVKGDATITKVVMKAKGHKIAGDYTVTASCGTNPVVTMGENAVEEITLNCGEGVELSTEIPTLFTFAVPSFTFAADEVSFDIYDDGGCYMKDAYTINKGGTIIANAYYTIAKSGIVYEPNATLYEGFSVVAPGVLANGEEYAKASQYLITNKKGLQWLATTVNAGTTFSKKTVSLVNDIDLKSEEWTPIGNSTTSFQGTFDGEYEGKIHTISNLVVNGAGKSDQGFFGMTTNGEIKNLIVENAKVSGRLNVGVVAGTPYTSKYTNITVKGLVQVDGMAYVGGVGGKNAYANWTYITIDAVEGSYVKANSVEDGVAYRTYVGGVSGFNGEGGHTFKNITSNINVEGTTCDVGGLFGIAHYGNKFEDCSSSGNVTLSNPDDASSAEEIGGIAGVWHNGGADVVFTNCFFTGTLKANVTEGVDLSDNTIVGKAYSATGTGKLIVDGNILYVTLPSTPIELSNNIVTLKNVTATTGLKISGSGTLILDNVSIEFPTEETRTVSTEETITDAIVIDSNENVTLQVKNTVTLTGKANGISVPAGATLIVDGDGKLTAEGRAGSGIGGAGSITIQNIKSVIAKGNGDSAFGIGGNGASVTIKDATIDYACGGHIQPLFVNDTKYGKSEPEGGAAIGGATIKIEGSTITKADGGSKAAAIGAQYWQSTDIVIIDSEIKEANGGNASAGIGGSRYANDEKHNVSIKIKNSTVTATGGQGGAGIGAGYDTHCNGQDYTATNYIEIDATSTINAKGGKFAPGIGTGFHSAYLSGSIAEGAQVTSVSGDNYYRDNYTTAQNIGYGVVDPAREFSGANALVTFTVAGKLIEHPTGYAVTEEATFIYNAKGMLWLANEVNVKEYAFTGKTVKLCDDIDLDGIKWEPIGQTGATTFNGIFDGQNHTISNLNVNSEDQTGAHYSSGLFGWVESHTANQGHLKNVKISGATIKGHHNCGALVGYITEETALVENCHVTGATVSCTFANGDADGDKAGALIGNATVATPVKDCTAAKSTVSAGRDAGQVIGAGKEANVTGCSAKEVTVSPNGTGTGNNVRNEVIGRLL